MIAAGLVLVAALAQTPYADAVLKTPGLIAYWRFEETSPSQPVLDSKGGNNGVYPTGGQIQVDVPGSQGLDGGTAFTASVAPGVVQFNATGALEQVPATAEFWIRINDPGDFAMSRSVLRQTSGKSDGGTSTSRHWYLGFPASTDGGTESTHMIFGFTPDGNSNAFKQVETPLGVSIGDWHLVHLILSAHRLALYVDAVKLGEIDPSSLPPTILDSPIFLGSVGSGSYSFDELAFYSGVLADDVIVSHYELGGGKVAHPPVVDKVPPNAFTFGCHAGTDELSWGLAVLALLLMASAGRKP